MGINIRNRNRTQTQHYIYMYSYIYKLRDLFCTDIMLSHLQ